MLLNKATGETRIDGTEATVIFTVEALMWVENNLPDVTPMEILERARQGRVSPKTLQILIWAGMEAHRRRMGQGSRPVNPAKAIKIIEQGGGMTPVATQVMEALMRSTGLGLTTIDRGEDDEQEGADEPSVPTMADESGDDSSAPVFAPSTPGS
ncbi:MAG TPA: hypothetical protein VGR26_15045 [Acidimicrobiales bacterium]|nr:hypothetical protein [Acidimicrobiales bacterium]